LILDATLAECPLYHELDEIYSQNPALNPPFTCVAGGITPSSQDEYLASDHSDEESEDLLSQLPPIQEHNDQPVPFQWSPSPSPHSSNLNSQPNKSVSSLTIEDESDETSNESINDFLSPPSRTIFRKERNSKQPVERSSTSIPPLARNE